MALMLTISPTYAQVDQTMLVDGDTLTYRYVPADQTHAEVQSLGVVSGRSILDYLTFGDSDLSPGASFTVMGAPFYAQERGWGLALAGKMRYRTRCMTVSDTPSSLRLKLSASLTAYYSAELDGRNWLGGNRHRVSYGALFASEPTYVWGLDYASASGNRLGSYTSRNIVVEGAYAYHVEQGLMVGVHAEYRGFGAHNLSAHATEVLGGEVHEVSMLGFGVDVEYDTRRVEGMTTRGLHLVGRYTLRNYLFDDIPMGHNVVLRLDYYQPLWRGATLLFDICGEYNSPDTPWMLSATFGGNSLMRGYYLGRYIGDNLLAAQVELEQHIWQGLGVAAWGGAGTIFSVDDGFAWRKVLPTYGVGLRWGVGGGTSLYIDVAFGKGSHAIIAGFSEVF